MAAGIRLPVYTLLFGSLATLFMYWEGALAVPQSVLVAAFSVYSVSNFVLAQPRAGLARKFCVCLVLTFADIVYTAFALRMPLPTEFYFFVAEFVCVFVVLQKLHPHEKCWELKYPLLRGLIYMSTGFFMALGVAQGLELALQGPPSTLAVAHAAVVVVGKQVLTTCVYLADEFFCDPKPVRQIQLTELVYHAKAGAVIFALLLAVWRWAPVTHPEFTWCAFVANIIYQAWGAFDTVTHEKFYSKLDL